MNFRLLDPNTGDASCEMRVSFILDAIDMLSISSFNPGSLNSGFISMYGPEFCVLPTEKSSSRGETLPKEGTMPEHYFALFYPLSITRLRAEDSLHFIIYKQPEQMTYSNQQSDRFKSAEAQFNVDYMRKLASFQAESVGYQAPILGQISKIFNMSKIEMRRGHYRQPILPIFTAESFLRLNEYLHGRPMVLVLTRLGYDCEGGQYHFGTKVYMYIPN